VVRWTPSWTATRRTGRSACSIAVPHRVTNAILDAGGTVHERVFTDFKYADKLDPNLFDRP
jgi:hypothetical protein